MNRRTALVTGASAGLGVAFAGQLAAAGYDLVLVARRSEHLEAVAADLRERFGSTVTALAHDLSEPDTPAAIARALASRDIAVDYLVNNAGAAGPHLLDDRDWSVHARFFELMMISAAHLCHLFIPGMRQRGFGRVINVASMAGRMPRKGGCNYGPSKAYVIALSEDLALSLAGTGINVCALCPGFTHTEFHAAAGTLDFKASLPEFIWYDADTVVREALHAVEKGRTVYPSGRLYRLVDPFLQSVWTRRLFRMRAAR